MADVAMPRLSDSMEEGTILKWLKSDGDEVKRGEELVKIETDKANMTYEADSDGVLSIVAKEGDRLPVGETIAGLGDGSEAGGAQEQPEADTAEDEQPAAEEEQPSGNGKPSETPEPAPAEAQAAPGNGDGDGRVKASPVAKRMAREMGVELGQLKGSGPGGRIVKADVEAAAKGGGAATAEAEAPPQEQAAPAAEEAPQEKKADVPPPVVPGDRDGQTGRGDVTHQDLTRLQQTGARRMVQSKATAPEFVLNVEVDMDKAVELRKQLKAAAGDQPAPSFNDFVIKASALALRDFPRANGAYRDGKFELYSRVNVGMAVAGQGGAPRPA